MGLICLLENRCSAALLLLLILFQLCNLKPTQYLYIGLVFTFLLMYCQMNRYRMNRQIPGLRCFSGLRHIKSCSGHFCEYLKIHIYFCLFPLFLSCVIQLNRSRFGCWWTPEMMIMGPVRVKYEGVI